MKEKSVEILVERLITMVGKLMERNDYLHQRVCQLESIILENSSYKP